MESDILAEFLKYDKNLPLDAVENADGSSPEEPPDGRRQYHVTFSSIHDQRVPALLTLPENVSPPFPIIIMLHGALGHKNSFNQIKRSDFLVAAGYAILRIDGQYRGEREMPSPGGAKSQTQYHYRNRDAMIQTAVDLMRAIDYLESRNDIDLRRIGFIGFSMGGMVGTMFCAHESRIRAVALGITGGDFSKFKSLGGDEEAADRFREASRIIDPIHYASMISPRPLLMINGSRDEIIPKPATEALFNAARDPKRIIWYDCGHIDLPDEYLEEMKMFFDTELKRPSA